MARLSKSGRRPYRLGRRAETSEETRQRLVEATFHLHAERGIAETSMKDIAERAGVSVGTVYHHFPSYADAIVACGAYTSEHAPAPTSAIFEGAAKREERIARLARALFDYYERVPALASVRRDRYLSAALDAFTREEARNRRQLVGEAVGKDAPVALVAALLDLDAYRSLRREGFGTAEAADRMAALLNLALAGTPAQGRRNQEK